MTRWPEAFSRVVPEGDALAMTLGFRVGEVLLRSSWVWDVPEGDAFTITLGFNGLKWY